MSAVANHCPNCHMSLNGEQDYRLEIGHVIPGAYDGVLYWSCPGCQHAWPRFTDDGDRLTGLSSQYAAEHNRQVGAA